MFLMIHGDGRIPTDSRGSVAVMKSSPTGPTDVREARVTQQTSSTPPDSGEHGFTLLEVTCALAIVGVLASLALPLLSRSTSRVQLESYAIQVAAVLKADRQSALRRQLAVETEVSTESRSIRSGAVQRTVHIPDDVTF